MYYEYWKLQKPPFDNVPDPSMYVDCGTSMENAIAETLFAIEEGGECISVIVGDVGLGKTLSLRIIIDSLDESKYKIALITNPGISFTQLMREIIGQLTGEQCNKRRKGDLLEIFNKLLFQTIDEGMRALIFIDEANAMTPANLESLRLLTNLQHNQMNLFTIVLAGQLELARRLEHPKHANLYQRIGTYGKIEKLASLEKLKTYVDTRLKFAGATGQVFTKDAYEYLWEHSDGGVPRLINKIAKLSLKAGETNQFDLITGEVVNQIGECFQKLTRPSMPQRRPRKKPERKMLENTNDAPKRVPVEMEGKGLRRDGRRVPSLPPEIPETVDETYEKTTKDETLSTNLLQKEEQKVSQLEQVMQKEPPAKDEPEQMKLEEQQAPGIEQEVMQTEPPVLEDTAEPEQMQADESQALETDQVMQEEPPAQDDTAEAEQLQAEESQVPKTDQVMQEEPPALDDTQEIELMQADESQGPEPEQIIQDEAPVEDDTSELELMQADESQGPETEQVMQEESPVPDDTAEPELMQVEEPQELETEQFIQEEPPVQDDTSEPEQMQVDESQVPETEQVIQDEVPALDDTQELEQMQAEESQALETEQVMQEEAPALDDTQEIEPMQVEEPQELETEQFIQEEPPAQNEPTDPEQLQVKEPQVAESEQITQDEPTVQEQFSSNGDTQEDIIERIQVGDQTLEITIPYHVIEHAQSFSPEKRTKLAGAFAAFILKKNGTFLTKHVNDPVHIWGEIRNIVLTKFN